MTTPERWQLIEGLYHAALARDPRERAAFVRDASNGDEDLAREVESLLECEPDSHRWLAGHALDAVTAASVSDDIPAPLIGCRLGPYVIDSLLGFGGMGDVYRARDTKLGREVAIKILPDVFAAESDRRARFEREARVLASLNHPNIAAIYGFEDSSGVHALVLELVDGRTLAEHLQSGPLPLVNTLTMARQIASALEAAHAKGIVHRDLKPRNIALSSEGTVKVLDFGLATTAREDEGGVIVGTTPYMSPEQTRGDIVGSQTDIWSFGCVLFEMLTGQRAFTGETTSATMAAIVEREPPWHRLRKDTPPEVVTLTKRCLEKDAASRLRDISDARVVIERTLRDAEGGAAGQRRTRRWMIVATLAAALAALAVGLVMHRGSTPSTATHLSLSVPGSISPQLSASLSPDGRRIAYAATTGTGQLALWIRDLDSPEPRVVPGSDNAAHPFWSPDGRFIGFLAEGKVKKAPVNGGPVVTLAETAERAGPSWSRGGEIMFASRLGELGVISADGGQVSTIVANLGPGRQATWPFFLPDGRHFLFFVRSQNPEKRGIYAGSLDSNDVTFILQSEFKGAYAAGHLLFIRDHVLMAQPFDVARLALSGTPVRIANGVWTATGAGQASFSVADSHAIAFVNASVSHLQLAWYDRNGRALEHVGTATRYTSAPQLTRDGTHALIAQGDGGREEIWSLDTTTDTSASVSKGAGSFRNPVWAANGTRIAFQSGTNIVLKSVDGSAADEIVPISDTPTTLMDWSPDDHLLFARRGPRSLSDLWTLPLDGPRQPVPFLETSFNKTQAQVSPDGRWIAYTSYESGRDEVYVERFPAPGAKRKISIDGGAQPRWRADGGEIFYVASDSRLISVSVKSGEAFQTGTPEPLFKTRVIPHGSQSIGLFTMYDVAPDGRRFLCLVPTEDAGSPISVILDWTAALRR